jgi:hypothetical protein
MLVMAKHRLIKQSTGSSIKLARDCVVCPNIHHKLSLAHTTINLQAMFRFSRTFDTYLSMHPFNFGNV